MNLFWEQNAENLIFGLAGYALDYSFLMLLLYNEIWVNSKYIAMKFNTIQSKGKNSKESAIKLFQ